MDTLNSITKNPQGSRKTYKKAERGKTKKNVRTKEKEKRKKIHIKKEHENEKKRGFNVRKIKEKIRPISYLCIRLIPCISLN